MLAAASGGDVYKRQGQGGMGVVYAADRVDGAYQQRAAVKLLRDGFLDDAAEALLVSERQHLARLDHPNIARLLDGGQTASGRPYLVMEFVEGAPIDDYCRKANLGLVDRIKPVSYTHLDVYKRQYPTTTYRPLLYAMSRIMKSIDATVCEFHVKPASALERRPP